MYVCQHPRSDCITFRPKLADFAGAERNDVATHTELKPILKCATFMILLSLALTDKLKLYSIIFITTRWWYIDIEFYVS